MKIYYVSNSSNINVSVHKNNEIITVTMSWLIHSTVHIVLFTQMEI